MHVARPAGQGHGSAAGAALPWLDGRIQRHACLNDRAVPSSRPACGQLGIILPTGASRHGHAMPARALSTATPGQRQSAEEAAKVGRYTHYTQQLDGCLLCKCLAHALACMHACRWGCSTCPRCLHPARHACAWPNALCACKPQSLPAFTSWLHAATSSTQLPAIRPKVRAHECMPLRACGPPPPPTWPRFEWHQQ